MLWRSLIFCALLVGVGLLVEAATQRPGALTVTWFGWHIQTSAAFAAFVLGVLVLFLVLVLRLYSWLEQTPQRVALWRQARHQQYGLQRLGAGLEALASGDVKTARKAAVQAHKLLPNFKLADALLAESAALAGDMATADKTFNALSKDPVFGFIGIRGLAAQALAENQPKQALPLLEQACELRPRSPWVWRTLLAVHTQLGHYAEALVALGHVRKFASADELPALAVEEACLCLEEARRLQAEKATKEAKKRIAQGLKACPDFIPLSLFEAELAQQEKSAKDLDILAAAWQRTPREEVFSQWLHQSVLRVGPEKALKQATKLTRPWLSKPVGQLALARAMVRAKHHDDARKLLQKLIQNTPLKEAYTLLAEVEEAQNPTGTEPARLLKLAVQAPDRGDEFPGHVKAYEAWRRRRLQARPTASLVDGGGLLRLPGQGPSAGA